MPSWATRSIRWIRHDPAEHSGGVAAVALSRRLYRAGGTDLHSRIIPVQRRDRLRHHLLGGDPYRASGGWLGSAVAGPFWSPRSKWSCPEASLVSPRVRECAGFTCHITTGCDLRLSRVLGVPDRNSSNDLGSAARH